MIGDPAFFFIGVITAGFLCFKVLRFLAFHLRPSTLPKYKHGNEYWAVITGGGGGIGLGFTQELCRQGFNVIIVGHLKEELEDAKKELAKTAPSAKVKLIVLDATLADYDTVKTAISAVAKFNITMLINNVGGVGDVFTEHFKDLKRYTAEELDSVMNINNRFMTYLTHILLPTLLRNQPSTIINLSSGAVLGSPYQVLYGSSKAYVNVFSMCLDIELRAEGHKDIQVVSLVLGNVRSKGNVIPTSWAVPAANDIAKVALTKAGCGRSVCIPYWRHNLQIWTLELLPRSVGERVLTQVYRNLKDYYSKKGQ